MLKFPKPKLRSTKKMMKITNHDKENKGYLHKTGGRRNSNKMWNCIFCESTRIWGQTTLVLGLLKLEISLSFDKKYFARKSLSFRNIFAISIRLI